MWAVWVSGSGAELGGSPGWRTGSLSCQHVIGHFNHENRCTYSRRGREEQRRSKAEPSKFKEHETSEESEESGFLKTHGKI